MPVIGRVLRWSCVLCSSSGIRRCLRKGSRALELLSSIEWALQQGGNEAFDFETLKPSFGVRCPGRYDG
jgi:hypothetical protein